MGLYNILSTVITLFTWAIVARVILSWFSSSSSYNPVSEFLTRITEPVLAPLRRYVPRMGMLDLTPFIAIVLLLYIVRPLLRSLLT